MASAYLEAALRKSDTLTVHDALNKFIEIKAEPHERVLKLLGNMTHLPDEIFVLVRQNFTKYGKMIDKVGSFDKPSFRPAADGQVKDHFLRNNTGKKFNPKKTPKKPLPYSVRKNLIQ